MTPSYRKWAKILLILVALWLGVGALFHYVASANFKNMLQGIVQKESNGLYRLDAADVKLNLLAKRIVMKEAVLYCTDTSKVTAHHQLNIPSLYLGIQSWKELLLHKRVVLDSLHIQLPALRTHDHGIKQQQENEVAFHTSSIFDLLQKVATRLEVRSFNIENGAYTYSGNGNARPFVSNRINLYIKNFSRKNGEQRKLFASDDLNLLIHDQHWVLPDGIHTIHFKQLHFSGKNQQFVLDSCTLRKAVTAGASGISLAADKLLFNSKRLTALGDVSSLLLDTLVCIRPVLSLLPVASKNNKKNETEDVGAIIQELFSNINVKYIDVREGQFSIAGTQGPDNAGVNKVNVKIYNLTVNPARAPHIVTDSINLMLSKILFYSRDSAYQLSVDEFNFQQRDVIFKNAAYGPTPGNRASKAFTFTAPTLRLHDINLDDLLRKKLKAKGAMLYNPSIAFKTGPAKENSSNAEATDKLFVALAGVGKIIDVEDFTVVNGQLQFSREGLRPLKMEMKQLNTHILLNQLLVSDSLVDIQRALPALSFGELSIKRNRLAGTIKGYVFNGLSQRALAQSVQLELANGTTVKINQLSWQELNWNQLVNHEHFSMAKLGIRSMAINRFGTDVKIGDNEPLTFPRISINQFNAGYLTVNSHRPDTRFSFTAHRVALEQVSSTRGHLLWMQPQASVSNLRYDRFGTKVRLQAAHLRHDELKATQLNLHLNHADGQTTLLLPAVSIRAPFHSTDFSQLPLTSVIAYRPIVELVKRDSLGPASYTPARPVPVKLSTEQLIVQEGTFNHKSVIDGDTSTFTTHATLSLQDAFLNNRSAANAGFKKGAIRLLESSYTSEKMQVGVPVIDLSATNATFSGDTLQQAVWSSLVQMNWLNANVLFNQPDNMQLEVENFSGGVNGLLVNKRKNEPFSWKALLPHAVVSDASIRFTNQTVAARVESLQFDPDTGVRLQRYSVVPVLSEEESFATSPWQKDYITLRGASLALTGINLEQLQTNNYLQAAHLKLDSAQLTTARDKRIPSRKIIEKLMPGKLAATVNTQFNIDTVFITNSSIMVNEIAVKTEKRGTIPITGLNAVVTGIGNFPGMDSLHIQANAMVLDKPVRRFVYKESGADTLSPFEASLEVAPMELSSFSQVTKPMTNIEVTAGVADTLFASWQGNKHGAVGTIHFFYRDLKIRLLDKNDPAKKRFFLNLISSVSRVIVHRKNDDPAMLFFIRDRKKFVFNYWIKSITSGITSSVGVKNSKKYLREYRKVKATYSLPDFK